MLLAGLMDWIGSAPPTSESIAHHKTLKQGQIHLRSIWDTGGQILGHRVLELDGITAEQFLSESPGKGCYLLQGYECLRPASEAEQRSLPVFPTWGYLVMRNLAQTNAGTRPNNKLQRTRGVASESTDG